MVGSDGAESQEKSNKDFTLTCKTAAILREIQELDAALGRWEESRN